MFYKGDRTLLDNSSLRIEEASFSNRYINIYMICIILLFFLFFFFFSSTLLMLMKIIAEYCQCIDDVPMLVTDVMTRLCEVLKVSST